MGAHALPLGLSEGAEYAPRPAPGSVQDTWTSALGLA